MTNELLLIISLISINTAVLIAYKIFRKSGLYIWTVIATIAANIEVLIVVDAFGMEQTLGNILFASTFLVSDILSETEGKRAATKAVNIGIFANVSFVLISQSWLLYTPNANDWASESIHAVFANTPRLMIASVVVYIIAQRFDVWFYHYIWSKTTALFKDSQRGLWIRNNGSTLVSQLVNSILYTFFAFYGIYEIDVLVNIVISSYIIFVITSICDTPVVYLARKIHNSPQFRNETI